MHLKSVEVGYPGSHRDGAALSEQQRRAEQQCDNAGSGGSDGKVTGDEVSFKVSRTGQNGNTMTQKYTGKISGDTIKGKMAFERNGEEQTRDWEAKRKSDDKK